MTCRRNPDRLLARQLGELPPSERDACDRHLQACPRCRRLFAEMEGWRDAWESPDADAPGGWTDRVMEALETGVPPAEDKQRRRFTLPTLPLGRAAALHGFSALAATVALFLWDGFQWIPDAWLRLSAAMSWIGMGGDDLLPLLQYQMGKLLS